jgi:polyhydroxyalkanoate synthase
LLLVFSLVSRSYVLDLRPGDSFVERLRDAGLDVFLLDWGVPDEEEAENTLETYVDELLPRAVDAVLDATSSDDLTLLGYCLGGDLAVLAAAAHSQLRIRNLVCVATPADFAKMGPITHLLRSGAIEGAIDATGNVPASVVRAALSSARPTGDATKFANLVENLWDAEYLRAHQTMGRWGDDHIPLPGAVARQIAQLLGRENALMTGRVRLGGRDVLLENMRGPFVHVVAARDHLVPLAAAAPLVGLVGSAPREELVLDAGHMGLIVGRHAHRATIPRLIQWLLDHGEPAASRQVGRLSGPSVRP